MIARTGARALAVAVLLASVAADAARGATPDAPWVGSAARSARAILADAEDPRAWAGLAAALETGIVAGAAGAPGAGLIARALADSIAAATPALTDVAITSDAAGTHIVLHGGFDHAAVRLSVDARDGARLLIDVPGARSALAQDEFAGIDRAGVRRVMVLRLPGALRLVVQLAAPYTAELHGDAPNAAIVLAMAPLAHGSWHARDARLPRPAAAVPVPEPAPTGGAAVAAAVRVAQLRVAAASAWHATARAAADAGSRAAAAAGPAAIRAIDGAHTAAIGGAGMARRHIVAPALAEPERAASVAGGVLVLVIGAGAFRTGLRSRRPERNGARRAPTRNVAARGSAKAAKRAARRLRSARTLVGAGHDAADVARRTRLSRDAVRLMAAGAGAASAR